MNDTVVKKSNDKHVSILTWFILIPLTVIALGIFIVVNLFIVERVIIKNNTLYESATIRDAVLNDEFSWNTVYVYCKYRFTDADDIPYVDSLEVEIDDPKTLIITVYEKGILGYIRMNGSQKVYFDTDGIVTEISARDIPGIPEIVGLSCDSAVEYEQLPIDKPSLKNLILLTTTLRRSDIIPNRISYEGTMAPVLFYDNGIEVVIGKVVNLTQKIERMAAIIPMISENGILHLENWTEETTDIVFERGVSVSDISERDSLWPGSDPLDQPEEGELDNEGNPIEAPEEENPIPTVDRPNMSQDQ